MHYLLKESFSIFSTSNWDKNRKYFSVLLQWTQHPGCDNWALGVKCRESKVEQMQATNLPGSTSHCWKCFMALLCERDFREKQAKGEKNPFCYKSFNAISRERASIKVYSSHNGFAWGRQTLEMTGRKGYKCIYGRHWRSEKMGCCSREWSHRDHSSSKGTNPIPSHPAGSSELVLQALSSASKQLLSPPVNTQLLGLLWRPSGAPEKQQSHRDEMRNFQLFLWLFYGDITRKTQLIIMSECSFFSPPLISLRQLSCRELFTF